MTDRKRPNIPSTRSLFNARSKPHVFQLVDLHHPKAGSGDPVIQVGVAHDGEGGYIMGVTDDLADAVAGHVTFLDVDRVRDIMGLPEYIPVKDDTSFGSLNERQADLFLRMAHHIACAWHHEALAQKAAAEFDAMTPHPEKWARHGENIKPLLPRPK